MNLFRPDANARRFRSSAERMAMAPVPESVFIEAVEQLVRIDRAWIPGGEGSLYLRPFMIASEVFLGVKPSAEYIFAVIASPVGSYFKGGPAPVSIWVSENYTRAAIGGTGAVKCGGNYAASLRAQAEAIDHGCDQVVFLDAVERRYIEELGGMNIFFVFDDGSLLTPPLGTILPGITRDSIIALAKDAGTRVREEAYTIEQWRADAASGRLKEAFACGTAAVISPIGKVCSASGDFLISGGAAGPVAMGTRKKLVDIQYGRAPDPHDWIKKVFSKRADCHSGARAVRRALRSDSGLRVDRPGMTIRPIDSRGCRAAPALVPTRHGRQTQKTAETARPAAARARRPWPRRDRSDAGDDRQNPRSLRALRF